MNLDVPPPDEPTRWPRAAGKELWYLEQVLRSGEWGIDGPFQTSFEERFSALQTAKFGLCVANGTVALQLALEALDVGVDDEVVVPGLTWQATAAAVLDVNAVPVLVDIDPETYCLDPDLIEAAMTSRTRAIIVTHLYSSVADMARIMEISRRRGVYVIEDCAHAHGARWREFGTGSIGDVGCFSFQSAKVLAAGEGGFVTTNDEYLYERLYSLRNCGRRRQGSMDARWRPVQSGNYRMTEWQAAVLCAQLDALEDQLARRAEAATWLDEALREIGGVHPMVVHPDVRRRASYRYVFRYDASSFGGLSAQDFRVAVTGASGISVRAPYEPLNDSPYYTPLSKRRNRLTEEHCARIDPTRYRLPVARRAHDSEGMIVSHEMLLDRVEKLEALVTAIESARRR